MKIFSNNSKNLVLTISMGDFPETVGKIAHKYMKEYADKIGADFGIIRDEDKKYKFPTYHKYMMDEILEDYERILCLDNDVFIKRNSPNIFDLVPEDSLGMHNIFEQVKEGYKGWKIRSYKKWWNKYNNLLKEKGMPKHEMNFEIEKFYNAGVILVSRGESNIFKHQPIFQVKFGNEVRENYYTDKLIFMNNTKMYDLPKGYNFIISRHMTKDQEELFKILSDDDIYFIHVTRKKKGPNLQKFMEELEKHLYQN